MSIKASMRKIVLSGCLLVSVLLTYAQHAVTGHIVSAEDQKPVAGATIKVKGTNRQTQTNSEGSFSITTKDGDILIVTSVGFIARQINAGDDLNAIILAIDNKSLNEVVVTALGVKKETKRIGYAIQEVKGEDLVKARDANPLTGLTGKVAGLSVGASAELLRKPTVLLRGNEISLYVVDGIPISSDTWNISPDDIESYTVLKGPAAAALYGSRAQYGAILITTRKGGKRKGFTVEVNSSNVVDKGFMAFPRTQDTFGPGENAFYIFVDGKGGAPGGVDSDYDVWGPYFNGQLIPQYDSPVNNITGVRKAKT